MPQAESRTFHWQFNNPPAAIWPLLADTVRFKTFRVALTFSDLEI